jgi:hypothetical protein
LAFSISGWSQTSPAPTQDSGFNGRWEGVVVTPDGKEFLEKYTLKVDGITLTGTVNSGNTNISYGKIRGNEFFFYADVNGVTVQYSGTLSGDTIQMAIDYQGFKIPSTLKRSAPTPLAPPPAVDGP